MKKNSAIHVGIISTCVYIVECQFVFNHQRVNTLSYGRYHMHDNMDDNMDRDIEISCDVCFEKMRGDVLKRHMDKHLKEEAELKQSSKNTHIVEKSLIKQQKKFNVKLELGKIIKNIIVNNELKRVALTYEQYDALEILDTALVRAEYWGEGMVYVRIL